MRKYRPAPSDLSAALTSVQRQHHHDTLGTADVAVALVDGPNLPPVYLRAMPPSLRAVGGPDCVLEVDAEVWSSKSKLGQRALLDSGLSQLVTRRTANGSIALDGAGRPRLRRTHPDLPGIGYSAVLRRHKGRSIEYSLLLHLRDVPGGPANPSSPPPPKRQKGSQAPTDAIPFRAAGSTA